MYAPADRGVDQYFDAITISVVWEHAGCADRERRCCGTRGAAAKQRGECDEARGGFGHGGKRLRDDLEPGIWPLRAPDLRHRPALDADDVRGEVVRTSQQRRADAVHVRRNARTLEGADLVDGKAPRDDDSDGLETL